MSAETHNALFPGFSKVLGEKAKVENEFKVMQCFKGIYNPFRAYNDEEIEILPPSEYFRQLSLANEAVYSQ